MNNHDNPDLEPNEFSELGEMPLTDETITQEQINEMKMLGMDKPKSVTSERWWRLQDIRYEHEYMIQLAASGWTQGRIAEAVGYDQAHVSKALSTPAIKERVRQEIEKTFGADHRKMVLSRGLKAMAVVDEVLDSGKESEKASMAKYIIDHSIGKASQDIKVTKTTLSEVLVKIEEMTSNQLRDVNGNTQSLPKVKDHFDTIIEQIIPQGMVIGKRSSDEGKTE